MQIFFTFNLFLLWHLLVSFAADPCCDVRLKCISLLRRGSAEKSESRRKIPWKATAEASARSHAQYGCDPGESFCNQGGGMHTYVMKMAGVCEIIMLRDVEDLFTKTYLNA